jgi:precorrin-6B methylase 2
VLGVVALLIARIGGLAQGQEGQAPARQQEVTKATTEKPRLDVQYVPTPQIVVDAMLELAKVTADDVVYDLGCGDGRIVVTAARRYGSKAVGIDLDPKRVQESNENVERNQLERLVTIRQANLFQTDLSKATVVTMYLLPPVNAKLLPRLQKLKAGTRIVAHSFDLKGVKPDRVVKIPMDEKGFRTIYLYVTPLKFEDSPATRTKPATPPATKRSTPAERFP